VIFALDRGDKLNRVVDALRSEYHSRKTPELLLDLGGAQRMIGGAASLLYLKGQDASILAERFDPHRVAFRGAPAIEFRIVQEADPWHERQNGRISEPALVELIDKRITVD
jgi:hypothetical protein